MEIAIYASNKPNTYVIVELGVSMPEPVRLARGVKPRPWKTMVIERGRQRIGLDPDKVMDDIARDGYAVLSD